jgi:hypothetical protein
MGFHPLYDKPNVLLLLLRRDDSAATVGSYLRTNPINARPNVLCGKPLLLFYSGTF